MMQRLKNIWKKHDNVIFYIAGDSAGHILPAATLAQQTVSHQPATRCFLFTSPEASIYLDQHLQASFEKIIIWNMRRQTSKKNKFIAAVQAVILCFSSIIQIVHKRPKTIVSTGGALAVPLCLVGWALGCRIELYELNAELGKAIAFLLPYATVLKSPFDHADNPAQIPFEKIDYPIRPHQQAQPLTHSQPLCIAILGGSQGAQALNQTMQTFFAQHPLQNQLFIIHQTGLKDQQALEAWYKQQGYEALVIGYAHNFFQVYETADLVIARAGAGTLFELLHYKKRTLLLPLMTATSHHQILNAQAMCSNHPDLFSLHSSKNPTELSASLLQEIKKHDQRFMKNSGIDHSS